MDVLKKILAVTVCVFGITFFLAGALFYFEAFISTVRDGIDELVHEYRSYKYYKRLDKQTKNAYELSVKNIDEKEKHNGKG